MPILLICTVGGAPEPVVRSLLEEPRPERVVFICSERSEASITAAAGDVRRIETTCAVCGEAGHECINPAGILARAAAAGLALSPDQYQIVRVTDAQDPNRCMLEIARQLTPMVSAWRAGGTLDHQVIVDPTGGTKCMSAALGLVARRWKCTLRYVGGSRRGKGGLGVVLEGSEKVYDCGNPLDALGYRAAEDAIVLSNQMNFGAAAQLLSRGAAETSAKDVRRRLEALGHAVELFACWDRFAHKDAATNLHAVKRWLPEASEYLDARTLIEITEAVPEWKRRLDLLARSATPTRELVEDLLANAARRRHEERFDDAVARLYRALEALAQFRLVTEHQIPNTGKVPPARVPPDLLKDWACVRKADGPLKSAYRTITCYSRPSATNSGRGSATWAWPNGRDLRWRPAINPSWCTASSLSALRYTPRCGKRPCNCRR
jgi:CRISPR-associated protein (TIGR02710 family)